MSERAQAGDPFGLKHLVALWRDARGGTPTDFPGWPERGIALIGDFSGIQSFVFRPVPGAGGAARRLRARSFRVSAYTELAARLCLSRLRGYDPKVLYSGGGRFLIGLESGSDWRTTIDNLQREIDSWAWGLFEGELVFHLAAAPFDSGRIPWDALYESLQARRAQPLRAALAPGGRWETHEFYRRAKAGEARCDACSVTGSVHAAGDGGVICALCDQDEQIGRKVVRSRLARLTTRGPSDLGFAGLGMELCDERKGAAQAWLDMEGGANAPDAWPLLRHAPTGENGPLDFGKIADLSAGARKWLGYLRVDVDRAGKAFADLAGDPLRTWALSRLLHVFFTCETNQLLRSRFSNTYAVFGGGDDLFVVGPWNEVLDLALSLRLKFRELTNNALTFSAGLSLARPRDHILTKAREAGYELEVAKERPALGRHCGRDQIRGLGVTCAWDEIGRLLGTAKQAARWMESGEMPSRFLHQALELHQAWAEARRRFPDSETGISARYGPLLYYQIRRNVKPGPAKQWADSLTGPRSDWPRADFVLRYAMLASKRGEEVT